MKEAKVKQDSDQKTITSCGGVLFFSNSWVDVPIGLEAEAESNPILDVREVVVEASAESEDPLIESEVEETDETGYSASPGAVALAEDLGIDIALVEGSGAGGNVIKSDVQAYADKLYTEEV